MGLISICIHLMALFFPSFLNFIVGSVVPYIPNQPANSFHYNYSIIIHDFWQIDFSRNSGPFWEPGANAGFTVLALAFNLFLLKEKLISYKNVLFIIVIISTLSTSGYLALLFVLFFFFNRTGSLFLKLIFIAVLGFGLNYLIDNLDFLGAKLLTQYEEAESGNARVSRFASALLDLETIKNYPISGYPVIDARQGELTEEDFRTNGVFILLAGWGVVFFFIYFLYTYLGIKKVAEFYNNNQDGNRVAIFFLLLLFLIGFSENYFTRPIFMAFVMMYPFFPTVKFSAVSKIESANLTPFFETEKMSYTNITKSS